METPIRDAIRQFRENRPERVAARRDRIRDLLTPFSSDQEAPAAEPTSRIGKFLRSLGAGSSRQDLMPARKSILMPEARSPQTYANGPDTGADAGKRAYDGDGNLPDNPAMVLPSPAIQGGTTSLPAVPSMALPSPTGPTIESLNARAHQLGGSMSKPFHTDPATDKRLRSAAEKELAFTLAERDRLVIMQENKDEQARLEKATAEERQYNEGRDKFKADDAELRIKNAETARAANDLALQTAKAEENSLPSVMNQVGRAAESAYDTTNWKAFHLIGMSSNMVPKGIDKTPLPGSDAQVQELSRAPIARRAAAVMQQYGGLAGMPAEETLKLSSALAYAYPVTPGIKGAAAVNAEIARVQQQMNQTMNLTNNPKMFDYLGKLAHMVVYNAVGRTQAAAPAPAATGPQVWGMGTSDGTVPPQ